MAAIAAMRRGSPLRCAMLLLVAPALGLSRNAADLLEDVKTRVKSDARTPERLGSNPKDGGVRVGLRYMEMESPTRPFWMAVPYHMLAAWQADQVNAKVWDSGMFHERREARIAQHIFNSQCQLRARTGWLASSKPPLVLDVGANSGFFSLLALAHGCRATAYEPVRLIADFIELSVSLNNGFGERFTLHNSIVTAEKNVITNGWMVRTAAGERNRGRQEEKAKGAGGFVAAATSTTVSLDDTAFEDVLYLKIDVESHEPSVFASGARLLAEKRISYLLFECTYYVREFGFRAHLYVSIMEKLRLRGYRLYHLQAMDREQPTHVAAGESDVRGRIHGNSSEWFAAVEAGSCRGAVQKGRSFCQLDIFAVHPSATWPLPRA